MSFQEEIWIYGMLGTNVLSGILICIILVMIVMKMCSNEPRMNIHKIVRITSIFGLIFNLLWCFLNASGIYLLYRLHGIELGIPNDNHLNITNRDPLSILGDILQISSIGSRIFGKICINILYVSRLRITFDSSMKLRTPNNVFLFVYTLILIEFLCTIAKCIFSFLYYANIFENISEIIWNISVSLYIPIMIIDFFVSLWIIILFSKKLSMLIVSIGLPIIDPKRDITFTISINSRVNTQRILSSVRDATDNNNNVFSVPTHLTHMTQTNKQENTYHDIHDYTEYNEFDISKSTDTDELNPNTINNNNNNNNNNNAFMTPGSYYSDNEYDNDISVQDNIMKKQHHKKLILIDTVARFWVLSILCVIVSLLYTCIGIIINKYYNDPIAPIILFTFGIPLDSIVCSMALMMHFWFSRKYYKMYCYRCHKCWKKLIIKHIYTSTYNSESNNEKLL